VNAYLGLLPRALLDLDCQGETHQLAWSKGAITTLDHADPEGERMLAALGGEPSRCIAILDAWHRHENDLRVLALTPRGPGDLLSHQLQDGIPGIQPAMSRRRGLSFRGASFGSSSSGWVTGYISGSPGAGQRAPEEGPLDLTDVLALAGGLPERLAAGVLAHWTDRVAEGDAAGHRPALQAALYGRAALAVRAWLGGQIEVEVSMTEPDEPLVLHRGREGVHLALPFRWLTQVWAPGLSNTAGRFVLDATLEQGQLALLTADPDGGSPTTMTLQLP
jgi:hypothetical protein